MSISASVNISDTQRTRAVVVFILSNCDISSDGYMCRTRSTQIVNRFAAKNINHRGYHPSNSQCVATDMVTFEINSS